MDTSPLNLIQQLPIADQLRLVEQIWDGIATSEEPVALKDWHAEVARSRAQELDTTPDIAISREELWKRVDGNGA